MRKTPHSTSNQTHRPSSSFRTNAQGRNRKRSNSKATRTAAEARNRRLAAGGEGLRWVWVLAENPSLAGKRVKVESAGGSGVFPALLLHLASIEASAPSSLLALFTSNGNRIVFGDA